MRSVQAGRLKLDETTVRHIDLCLGCRACEATCPSGVQYGELLEETRAHIEKNYHRSVFQNFLRRVAIEKVFPFPRRMEFALAPAKILKSLRVERLLPKFLREALSLIPANGKKAILPELSPAPTETRRGRVGFISGCVMNVIFGQTNINSLRLLNAMGYDVATPKSQVCCGALYAHGGNLEQARACARRNIETFEKLELDAIIINAAGCGSTLKEYHRLLDQDPEWKERALSFSNKVKDLTEWMVENQTASTAQSAIRNPPVHHRLGEGGQSAIPITYHDACHLAHAQRITKPPRELVHAQPGANYIELPESDVCCGSAGSYNLTEPEMAERLQRRKIENILKTGAKVVVTTNPGCILQIRAGLEKAGIRDVRVVHIADYLAQSFMRE
jgi:glycolate oxidase iron-sulfur subunit